VQQKFSFDLFTLAYTIFAVQTLFLSPSLIIRLSKSGSYVGLQGVSRIVDYRIRSWIMNRKILSIFRFKAKNILIVTLYIE